MQLILEQPKGYWIPFLVAKMLSDLVLQLRQSLNVLIHAEDFL